MAVFRVEKTRDYTVMANHHLKDRRLSLKAKGLLSVMLSLPEEWDYTLKGLAYISREGVDAIRESIRELEQTGYIVRTRKRNEQGHLKGMEYVIYERSRPMDHQEADQNIPATDSPTLENPILENPTQAEPMQAEPEQDKPALDNPIQLITYRAITNSEKTQKPSTYAATPDPIHPDPLREVEDIRRLVKRNLSYDILVQDDRFPTGRLDEIVDLITETLCSRKEIISVAGDEYPAQVVKQKLLRLNSLHAEYVLTCLDRNTTQVRNIKKYMLAALFNAPSTIESYYAAQVNHDLYGGTGNRHRDNELPFYAED